MKTWKIVTALGLATVVLALVASSAYAYMGGYGTGFGGMMGRGGMMGGYGDGYYTNPQYPVQQGTAPVTSYQNVYPYQFGGGCLGGGFRGMMGGYQYGYGNGYLAPYANTSAPLNITSALTVANNYLASIGNADLAVKEVEEYTNNFYVQVKEKSTGTGAFELIVNKYTGLAYPEMGPNMMWNTKYGMMRSGVLGGIFGAPTTATTVTVTQAAAYAQQFLNAYFPNTTTGDATTFYGYYTIEVLSNGSPYGMLSVNGYTGQVWFHNWHGTFIQELPVA